MTPAPAGADDMQEICGGGVRMTPLPFSCLTDHRHSAGLTAGQPVGKDAGEPGRVGQLPTLGERLRVRSAVTEHPWRQPLGG